jgi:hypothetical protein
MSFSRMFGWGKRQVRSTSSNVFLNPLLETMDKLFTNFNIVPPTDEDKFNAMLSLHIVTVSRVLDFPVDPGDRVTAALKATLQELSDEIIKRTGNLRVKLLLVTRDESELAAFVKNIPPSVSSNSRMHRNAEISGALAYPILFDQRCWPAVEKIYNAKVSRQRKFPGVPFQAEWPSVEFVEQTILGGKTESDTKLSAESGERLMIILEYFNGHVMPYVLSVLADGNSGQASTKPTRGDV